ncbi:MULTISPECIES: GNAT family N-acetyltransferase [unclassified Agarivorans]|uniref:GNAT family N-acetyltransferase n=1 Tax=unclassified Agarivorans TaxID=2636026 RepID=UPI0026E1AD31|nr:MULTISPECIES: GNAT family N-acetyltransferase [unclassified Agarivorans]MDO6687282.1 GNAT family N-acetyltransferase [Agarivorans sp. 3_MG-2023]MDO6716791.1 GNAT family N-acetyltransferase [Agarivorans sp. 2_MG-2023]
MNFIPATEEHFYGISALVPTAEELYRIYPSATFPLDKTQLNKLMIERKDLTVLVVNEQVVAFANLYNVTENVSAFIGNVVVANSHRGSGIGKALMLHMSEICIDKYNASVHLAVFNFNTNALLLYSKLGYKPYSVEERVGFKKEPVALLHMSLS